MATKIQTISNALILVGDDTINTLGDGSYRARVTENLYDNVYEAELATHPWAFARRLQTLSASVDAPIIDSWEKIYALPSDLITLIRFHEQCDYEIYGSSIYTNATTLVCDYIAKVSESAWPGYFAKLMEYSLAKEFSKSIREDNATGQAFYNMYLGMGQKARAADSKQKIQRPIQSAPFLSVR
jgi:hypothetical protein